MVLGRFYIVAAAEAVVVAVVVVVVVVAGVVPRAVVDVGEVAVVRVIVSVEWMSLVNVDKHVVPPIIRPDAQAVHLLVTHHIVVKAMDVEEPVQVLTTIGVMEPAHTAHSAGHEPIPAPIHQVWLKPVLATLLERYLTPPITVFVLGAWPDWE